MPTLSMIILFQTITYLSLSIPANARLLIYLVVFFNTFMIPLTVSVYLLKRGVIRSLHMETTQERKIPFLVTAFAYTFTYYLLRRVPLSPVLYVTLMGAILAVIILILVNLKWKMSAHMTGFGGFTGAIFGIAYRLSHNLTILIVILFIVAGILGTARLISSNHTPAQIYTGFFNGFLCQLFMFAVA